jgi:hypothetical protein
MDLEEIGCEEVDWIQVTHNRVQWEVFVNMVMNL